MSAGPDELHLGEYREANELITDPLETFLEEAWPMTEVLEDQEKARTVSGTVSVFGNGNTEVGQTH